MSITSESVAAAPTRVAGKYLTFRVGPESYGIEVIKVREIMRLQPITPVPQMPAHIKGVLNLRGKIIPVMDLRLRLSMGEGQDTEETCIVVVQVALPSRAALAMGLVVDAVEEVINFAASDIEEAPDFGTAVDTAYILGMAKMKGVVKILLDIDKVVAAQTIELIQDKISG